MFDFLKNAKYLKPLLIIVAIILGLNVISFIISYWWVIVLAIALYVGYKGYKFLKL